MTASSLRSRTRCSRLPSTAAYPTRSGDYPGHPRPRATRSEQDVTPCPGQPGRMTRTKENPTEVCQADFALDGGHVTEDCFARTRIVFDYLMPWVNPPGIIPGSISLTAPSPLTRGKRSLPRPHSRTAGQIRLLTGAYHQHGKASAHVDQWCAFEVEGSPAPIADILSTWVRPLPGPARHLPRSARPAGGDAGR